MANDGHEPTGDGDAEPAESTPSPRRRAIKYGVLAALAGVAGVGAGVGFGVLGDRPGKPDVDEPKPTATDRRTPTAGTGAVEVPALVERFAPDLHFGRRERWFPTDPRPYASGADGRTVVDGFDALSGYSREFRASGAPPRPTVFYHVAPVDGSVVALQYWMYSVFDQFSVNFHWHDWELLQVFVDADADEPLLLVASAHARKCPNNEFLHPGLDGRPAVLSEVGSHSSATDVNERHTSFERLAAGALGPDVSNGPIRPLDGLAELPFAYGLPRGEGARLPFALPELDGVPLPEHPALADVGPGDFVAEDVTVRSWGDLARPPGAIPTREPGTVVAAADSPTDADATYELLPIEVVRDSIDDFTGPRLGFEFAVPGFAEELVADHITTAGLPWENDRFSDPAADITDPDHRRAVVGDTPGGLADRVVGAASLVLGRPDGDLDAVDSDDREGLEPFVPVSLFPLPVEVACLLRSDPAAVPTSGGVFRFLHVEPGAHELVINGPGIAPYAERFDHRGGTVRPGANGRVALVANEDAAVLRGDRRGAGGVRRVRVVEPFVGPIFDARPVEDDRFAIPVHRDGTYTVEITDRDGVRGAVRVDPAELDGEPIPRVETGKASLVRALVGFLVDSAEMAYELEGSREIPAEFDAASQEAARAVKIAAGGDADGANELLTQIVERLRRVRELLADPDRHRYGPAAASALRHRAADGIDRAAIAIETPVAG